MCKHDHAPEEGSDFDWDPKELEKDSKQVAKEAKEYMNEQSDLCQTHTWRRQSGRGTQSPVFYLYHCEELQKDK